MLNLIPYFIHDKYRKEIIKGRFEAITMFVDIVGFTSITENLMRQGIEGAELLSEILNKIFLPVIDAVYERRGFISGFAGDSFTAIYPKDSPLSSLISAINIQSVFQESEVSARIGLSYGKVSWGIVGPKNKKTYFFKGESIKRCVRNSKKGKINEVILDHTVYKLLPKEKIKIEKVKDEYYRVIPSLKIKEKAKPISTPEITKEVVLNFFPQQVVSLKIGGEFRDVVSVFISFKDIENFEGLNKFIEKIINKTGNFGGYFNTLDYGDKGPAILILFGAPVSYEDNIERASNFILSVKNDFQSRIRAGIAFGPVYAGIIGSHRRCTYTVLGAPVNLSARLMSKADWNQIWVSENIARKILKNYRIRDLKVYSLKGISQPMKVFELLSIQERKERISFEGEMVGRDEELKRAIEFCKPLYNGKSGGVVYIYGDAGIGKSRLLYEISKSLKPTIKSYTLKTEGILRRSMNPFINFFKNYFHQLEENTPQENKDIFEKIYNNLIESLKTTRKKKIEKTVKELLRTKSIIGALIGLQWENSLYERLEPKSRFENILFSIKEFFKAESLIQPVIMGIEDIQWIDEDSKKVFKILTRKIEDYPIIIFASSRLNDNGTKPTLDIDPDVLKNEIMLKPLSRREIEKLVKNQLGASPDSQLLLFIQTRSEGNPFYIQQFCRFLKDNQFIKFKEDKYTLTKTHMDIPPGIKSLLTARLDRLSPELKKLLQTACVLGKEFDVYTLSEMLKEVDVTSLLAEGQQQEIWVPLRENKYIFKHILLKDTAYRMQLRKELKKLHKKAGEAMEKLYGEDKSRYSEIAFHYEKAGIREKTREYLQKAAEYAREQFQNKEAVELYDKLLSYIDEKEETVKINYKKSGILFTMGKWKEAEEILRENIEKAKKIKKDILVAQGKERLGVILRNKGAFEEGLSLLEDAKIIYEKLSDQDSIALVLGEMGGIYHDQGDYRNAIKFYLQSLTVAEKFQNKRAIGFALAHIGDIFHDQGGYDKAMEYYFRALNIIKEVGNDKNIARITGSIGNVYLHKGELTQAMKYYKKSLEIAKRTGHKQYIGFAVSNIGNIYLQEGKYKEALKYYEIQLSIGEELGDKYNIGVSLLNIGEINFLIGNYPKAMEHFQKATEIFKILRDKASLSFALFCMGNVYKKEGKHKEAEEVYTQSIVFGRELNLRYYLCNYLFNKADLYFLTNRIKEAESLNRKAIEMAEEMKRDDVIFKSRVLEAKILSRKNKRIGIEELKKMLNRAQEDSEKAVLIYELFNLTKKESYRIKALSLYHSLYQKTQNIEYKEKIKDLTLNLSCPMKNSEYNKPKR